MAYSSLTYLLDTCSKLMIDLEIEMEDGFRFFSDTIYPSDEEGELSNQFVNRQYWHNQNIVSIKEIIANPNNTFIERSANLGLSGTLIDIDHLKLSSEYNRLKKVLFANSDTVLWSSDMIGINEYDSKVSLDQYLLNILLYFNQIPQVELKSGRLLTLSSNNDGLDIFNKQFLEARTHEPIILDDDSNKVLEIKILNSKLVLYRSQYKQDLLNKKDLAEKKLKTTGRGAYFEDLLNNQFSPFVTNILYEMLKTTPKHQSDIIIQLLNHIKNNSVKHHQMSYFFDNNFDLSLLDEKPLDITYELTIESHRKRKEARALLVVDKGKVTDFQVFLMGSYVGSEYGLNMQEDTFNSRLIIHENEDTMDIIQKYDSIFNTLYKELSIPQAKNDYAYVLIALDTPYIASNHQLQSIFEHSTLYDLEIDSFDLNESQKFIINKEKNTILAIISEDIGLVLSTKANLDRITSEEKVFEDLLNINFSTISASNPSRKELDYLIKKSYIYTKDRFFKDMIYSYKNEFDVINAQLLNTFEPVLKSYKNDPFSFYISSHELYESYLLPYIDSIAKKWGSKRTLQSIFNFLEYLMESNNSLVLKMLDLVVVPYIKESIDENRYSNKNMDLFRKLLEFYNFTKDNHKTINEIQAVIENLGFEKSLMNGYINLVKGDIYLLVSYDYVQKNYQVEIAFEYLEAFNRDHKDYLIYSDSENKEDIISNIENSLSNILTYL